MKAKQILRKQLRQQIAKKPGGSEDISLLQNYLDEFANFANKTVALYQADSHELCLTDFFKSSQVLLPRFNAQEKVYDFSLWSGEQKDLQMGPYDIAEPRVLSELNYIDYCFIPALAFDRRGNRLGRGGGFYDRLLAKYSIGTKVGVCYDFQLIEDVPSEDHDYIMDFILSPSGLFKCDRKN